LANAGQTPFQFCSLGKSNAIMHAAILLLSFWAAAFVTLGAAVVLLSIFCGLIDNDLELHSIGKEAVIAGIASLLEGAGVWLVVWFIPVAYRALGLRSMMIPALVVALIYKMAHLEDWSRFEAILLLVFQVVIGSLIACLMLGRFEAAIFILVGFGMVLAVIAVLVKSL